MLRDISGRTACHRAIVFCFGLVHQEQSVLSSHLYVDHTSVITKMDQNEAELKLPS